MPQETKSMPDAVQSASPAGWAVNLSDAAQTMTILEKAFDFRGDITLTLKNGQTVAGYLFDRKRGQGLGDSVVRIMPPTPGPNGEDKVNVKYADIAHIAFSDRDPAAGKSFETWVKKYVEKKLAGEKASIESEALD
jgi:hypothetical protein